MMKQQNLTHPWAPATALLSLLLLLALACSRDGKESHEENGHESREYGDESVQLTVAQVEASGIRVTPATSGEILRFLTMPAVVAANADAITHVNPRVPGIVRSIGKHLGEAVKENELLCVIDSIDLGKAVAEYVRAKALVDAAVTTLAREGKLFQQGLEMAEIMLEGTVEVNLRIHDREQELQEMAVSTIRPLLEAERNLQNSKLKKDRDLTDLRAERDTRLLALEVELTERQINQDAARSALLTLGVASTSLDQLEPGSPLLAGSYEIRAPRDGIVSGRHITTGEFVDAETRLYTLVDLSQMWILASAFEGQITSVRTGQKGLIHLDAFPDRIFEGRVTIVGYEVDASSRALVVRLELENTTIPDWPEQYPIRPGMFGSVDLVIGSSSVRITLPESAIVHENEGDFIFVRTAPGIFERRRVELGPPSGEVVEIIEGVELGEEVVVEGIFQLKSALRKGELGAGHSH